MVGSGFSKNATPSGSAAPFPDWSELADPLPVGDRSDGIDPESNLHPTEYDMAKEVYA